MDHVVLVQPLEVAFPGGQLLSEEFSLFYKPAGFAGFERNLTVAHDRIGMRIAAYWLIPKHCHLILRFRRDGEVSEVLRVVICRFCLFFLLC